MSAPASNLRKTLDDAAPRLARLDDERTAQRPAPGKWSAREILGHLVDSAANNHPRFVLAQGRDDLDFPGYEQERWVSLQRYQDEPWSEILALWIAYNRHIVHLVERIPRDELARPHRRHSLARIAWKPVDAARPATLGYLIDDYVDHLRHHLAQIYAITGG